MKNLGNFGDALIFRVLIRRDFDRISAEEWFLIVGFFFLISGLILSSLKLFLWLGGLILFIYFATAVIWVVTKIR